MIFCCCCCCWSKRLAHHCLINAIIISQSIAIRSIVSNNWLNEWIATEMMTTVNKDCLVQAADVPVRYYSITAPPTGPLWTLLLTRSPATTWERLDSHLKQTVVVDDDPSGRTDGSDGRLWRSARRVLTDDRHGDSPCCRCSLRPASARLTALTSIYKYNYDYKIEIFLVRTRQGHCTAHCTAYGIVDVTMSMSRIYL